MKRALVYSSLGLGDGLIFLVLSKNLSLNGYLVDTLHPFLSQMKNWIDYTDIKPYPKIIENSDFTKPSRFSSDASINFDFLKSYDLIIINSDYEKINKEIVKYCKKNFPDITFELHPSTCKGKKPHIGDWKFDFTKSVVDNLNLFCRNKLKLERIESTNSIKPLKYLKYRKFPKRIAIHPASKDINRNWPKEKFYKLCLKLKKNGFEPCFLLTESEKCHFEDIDIEQPKFNNLEETASFIYESGYVIGNDSGICHLSSSLKIPTLTIFATKRKEKFWGPSFFIGKTVSSWPLINISHMRLREKYWQKTISVRRVLKNFIELVKEYESSSI